MRLKTGITLLLLFCLSVGLVGCTFIFQKGRRSDIEKIEQLSTQLDELSSTKQLLEDRLKQEIADKQVRLQMAEKGLVITFVADVLFDSGKAKLRTESFPVLDKVSRVLSENVPQNYIGIEGHTDSIPIKYSSWKSNWELSAARALSVLHYLEKVVAPERLSAVGYGEYKPVASNDTKEGRQMNRRVEVVILPSLTKVKGVKQSSGGGLAEPQENLK
jgi:chemotaxis protein MotB